jgi:hypothetical protein
MSFPAVDFLFDVVEFPDFSEVHEFSILPEPPGEVLFDVPCTLILQGWRLEKCV